MSNNQHEVLKKGATLAASAAIATLAPQPGPAQAQQAGAAQQAAPIVAESEIARGPFKPTDESLQQYQYPDWFRDAKFGIWAHSGARLYLRHEKPTFSNCDSRRPCG